MFKVKLTLAIIFNLLTSMNLMSFIHGNIASQGRSQHPAWTKQIGASEGQTAGAMNTGKILNLNSGNYILLTSFSGQMNGGISTNRSCLKVENFKSANISEWSKIYCAETQAGSLFMINAVLDSQGRINVFYNVALETGDDFTNSLSYFVWLVLDHSGVEVSYNKLFQRSLSDAFFSISAAILNSQDELLLGGFSNSVSEVDINVDIYHSFLLKLNRDKSTAFLKKYITNSASILKIIPQLDGSIDLLFNMSADLESISLIGQTDLLLRKVDSTGNTLWNWHKGESGSNIIGGDVIAHQGDYYIAGITDAEMEGIPQKGGQDLFVYKINTNQNVMWVKKFGRSMSDCTNAFLLANYFDNNKITILSNCTNGIEDLPPVGSIDIISLELNILDGSISKKNLYGKSSLNSTLVSFTQSNVGENYINIYTNGDHLIPSLDTNHSIHLLSKLDHSLNLQLIQSHKIYNASMNASAMNVDKLGNVYIAGQSNGDFQSNTLTTPRAIFVSKYSRSGVLIWTFILNSQNFSLITSVSIDSNNNVYLVGKTNEQLDGIAVIGSTDSFIIKLNSSGQKIWSKRIGNASKTVIVESSAVDSQSNLLIFGITNGSCEGGGKIGVQDYFIVKYDGDGNKISNIQVGVPTKSLGAVQMQLDSQDNIYITGSANTNLDGVSKKGALDTYVSKYNSALSRVWTTMLGTAPNGLVRPTSLYISSYGDIYLSGTTDKNLEGNAKIGLIDSYIAKINSNGSVGWLKLIGGLNSTNSLSNIVESSERKIYLAINYSGSLLSQVRVGLKEFVILKLDEFGNITNTKFFQPRTKMTHEFRRILFDGLGNLYILGNTSDQFDFQLKSSPDEMFITKFSHFSL